MGASKPIRKPIVIPADKMDKFDAAKPDPAVMKRIRESAAMCQEYNLKK